MDDSYTYEDEVCDHGSTGAEANRSWVLGWWLEGVFSIAIGVVGIVANVVAVPILFSRKMANVFNRTLAILAILDTVFIILDILESIRMFHEKKGNYWHLHLFPYFLYPMQNIAMVASIYLTVVVAVERYLAVSRPVSVFMGDAEGRRWGKVFNFVMPVVIFSVLFNLPTFFEFSVIDRPATEIAPQVGTYTPRPGLIFFHSNKQ
jgi:hypothetical protein